MVGNSVHVETNLHGLVHKLFKKVQLGRTVEGVLEERE